MPTTFANILVVLARMSQAFQSVWEVFDTPIGELFNQLPQIPVVTKVLEFIVDKLQLQDATILALMVGYLLVIYIIWQFLTWFLNIVT